jgi:hypothetical protein
MTIIVGIFDSPQALDEAIVQLAEHGFDETVYDQSIVAQEMGVARPTAQDKHALVEAFKKHLNDYHVPPEVIASYVTSFFHEGKIVIVKTDGKRAPEAERIMRRCRASRVNQHG